MRKSSTLLLLLVVFLFSCGKKAGSKNDAALKTDRPVLIIDAGHGGLDPGGINVSYKLYEKNITRKIVDAILSTIDSNKIRVIETRPNDENISRHIRIKNAAVYKPNLLLTIHTNFDDNASISGLEVAYSDSSVKKMDSTNTLYCVNPNKKILQGYAQILGNNIGKAFPNMRMRHTKDRCDHIWMICAPTYPSMLVEFGFITNKMDVGIMTDPKVIQKLATTITQSVYAMLKI